MSPLIVMFFDFCRTHRYPGNSSVSISETLGELFLEHKGGGVERRFYYSKEKLGNDSSYSVGKAEFRDLEISKNWVVSFGGKKCTITFIT